MKRGSLRISMVGGVPVFVPNLDHFQEKCVLRVDLHWSESEQMYCDVSVDDDGG